MIAIIVVGYTRPFETRRLVNSIIDAQYDNDTVDLIVSIDKGPKQQEVCEVCENLKWTHGSYQVIKRENRLGLRPHILLCGEMTEKYDGVIVLEDDLVVSKNFYRYAKQAMDFFEHDDRVAQISLYSYAVNEFVSRPFCPEKNEYDVYAMRVTQSWGECWTKNMWEMFKASHFYSKPILERRNDLPENINKWRENSWKKNFSNYLVGSNKFVIYPYISFTTNYTIAGEHCKMDVPDYHVVLQHGNKKDFSFCKLDECIKYDQFFERLDLTYSSIGLLTKKVCLDLYGSKTCFDDAEILITTKRLSYKVIKTYKLERKPHEENLIYPEEGIGIYVYDLSIRAREPKRYNSYFVIRYDVGCLHWKRAYIHFYQSIIHRIRNKLYTHK